MIQVKTSLAGNEQTSGHNRFSLRAYGASSADNDAISVAGYNKMAMYANTPNGTSKFYLARVPMVRVVSCSTSGCTTSATARSPAAP